MKDILKPSIAFFHVSHVTFVVNHPKIDKSRISVASKTILESHLNFKQSQTKIKKCPMQLRNNNGCPKCPKKVLNISKSPRGVREVFGEEKIKKKSRHIYSIRQE